MNFLIQSQNIMKIILWKFLIGRCAKVYAPKRVEFEWTFDLLLINFTVVRVYFSVFLTMPRKYFMWMNINFMGNRSWNKANIFTCFWYWCWKNRFFNVKLTLYINNFYKHIFRSNFLQIFFKISALKNPAILRIKKRLQHRCFPVRSIHVMLTYW